MRLFDADRHVLEPFDLWARYLQPAWRSHAPAIGTGPSCDSGRSRSQPLVDGEPIFAPRLERTDLLLTHAALDRMDDLDAACRPERHLRAMDAAGLEMAVLYPTYAHYLTAIDGMNPLLAAAFASAYNDWLYDFCREDPRRLRGVGLVSRHDPPAMLVELERIAAFGWRAVVVRPNPIAGRTLGDPAYEPFWTACERLRMVVAVHEGTHARVPTAGANRFRSRFAQHACSHPMELMMAFLSLLEAGVLERHAQLEFAFLEAGAGWLPYWLWRLDDVEYTTLAGEVAENVVLKPSAYFQRQCFVSVEPGEPCLGDVLAWAGEDRVLFGTDFPHLDHGADIVKKALGAWTDLPERVQRKLLWANAARCYRVGEISTPDVLSTES